ncbi:dihydrouridine synthase-domain-containing protein [Jimgerdemannia flammicorona]|uniref:Dihydrouridine synthase-domain-containing protein n=1 Tax=Jimgerdemannia flammicorona TaxID=994334 RepID=A0A433D5E4_9FUNG|nr:dihydrouridine synthase-domain-containing protein [Jimgerdemannia flammicorona]
MPTTIRLRHSISLHRNALITLPNVRSVTSGIPLPRKSRLARTTSVAPMIDVTNPHFLHLLRLISSSHTLYSEMVHANAIIKNAPSPSSPASLYRFIGDPHPDTVVQLGGSDPEQMARAAKIVEQVGFGEVNVNVGCPSDRVQHGCFGVVLMKTPDRVASILDAMHAHGVHIPVTVKCRIGVDDLDSYEYLCHFLSTLLRSSLPPTHVIVHARKAWLHGLSPKQNRTVPPLDYERVWRLAKEFHGLVVTANGGFDTVEKVRSGLERCDGIMIGRKVMDEPMFLQTLDRELHNIPPTALRPISEIIDRYVGLCITISTHAFSTHNPAYNATIYYAPSQRHTPSLSLLLKPLSMLRTGGAGRRFRRCLGEAMVEGKRNEWALRKVVEVALEKAEEMGAMDMAEGVETEEDVAEEVKEAVVA